MARELRQNGTASDATSLDEIARRLREARAASGLTQKEVAAAIGAYPRRIHEWESGQAMPRESLPKLAETYGRTVTWLLTGTETDDTRDVQLQAELQVMRDQLARISEASAAVLELVSVNLTTQEKILRDLRRDLRKLLRVADDAGS